jgi:hypothetical protein
VNRLLLEQQQQQHRRLLRIKLLPKRTLKTTAATQAGDMMPCFVIVNALEDQQCRWAAPAPPLRTVETFDKTNKSTFPRTSKTEQDEAVAEERACR